MRNMIACPLCFSLVRKTKTGMKDWKEVYQNTNSICISGEIMGIPPNFSQIL